MNIFSKGNILSVKFTKISAGYTRVISGHYEVVRTGRRLYLFCNETGDDWSPTKEELVKAIEEYKKN